LIPKDHLGNIFRTPVDKTDRQSYIRLDKNEWTVPYPDEILNEIKNTINSEFLSCYPAIYQIYDALSKFHSLSEDHFLVAAGSDGAIRAVFDAFISPGDEIINIQPNFAMYSVYAQLYGANEVGVFYNQDNLSLDLDDIIGKINKKTRFIILSNPNSPAGVQISNNDIKKLLDAAAVYNAGVLVDEAYYPISGSTALSLLDDYDNMIIFRSFSKAFGLAAARVGYAVGNPVMIEMLAKFKPMYEINSLGVLCSVLLLKNYPIIEESIKNLLRNKEKFVKDVEKLGLQVLPSGTNFVNIVVGTKNCHPLIDAFEKQGILIRPGYEWGILKQCIRISIGDEQSMEKVYYLLKKWRLSTP
jgi:histidinol-phosphate aminotransferase